MILKTKNHKLIYPQLQGNWCSNLTILSVTKRDERRSKRKVFGQLKPPQCFNVKLKTVLETAGTKYADVYQLSCLVYI